MKKSILYILFLLLLNCLEAKKSPFDLSNPSSPMGSLALGNFSNIGAGNTTGLSINVSLVSSMIEGETRSFPISLSTAPENNISITVSAPSGFTVSSGYFTFTTTNYSNPQSITITAQEEDNDTVDNVHSISFSSPETGTQIYSITIRDNDRRVFVTNATYTGNLGGISGADAKCMSDTDKPATGTYKALLVDSSTGISTFLQSNMDYRRASDSTQKIFTSNSTSNFDFGTGSFSNGWAAGSGEQVWTGLNSDWSSSNVHCGNWTSTSNFGVAGRTDATNFAAISNVSSGCGSLNKLICVEQ